MIVCEKCLMQNNIYKTQLILITFLFARFKNRFEKSKNIINKLSQKDDAINIEAS